MKRSEMEKKEEKMSVFRYLERIQKSFFSLPPLKKPKFSKNQINQHISIVREADIYRKAIKNHLKHFFVHRYLSSLERKKISLRISSEGSYYAGSDFFIKFSDHSRIHLLCLIDLIARLYAKDKNFFTENFNMKVDIERKKMNPYKKKKDNRVSKYLLMEVFLKIIDDEDKRRVRDKKELDWIKINGSIFFTRETIKISCKKITEEMMPTFGAEIIAYKSDGTIFLLPFKKELILNELNNRVFKSFFNGCFIIPLTKKSQLFFKKYNSGLYPRTTFNKSKLKIVSAKILKLPTLDAIINSYG